MPATFRKFNDINELTDWLKVHSYVYYHAPLDINPHSVEVRDYTISNVNFEKNKASLYTKENGVFKVVLIEHFDRFRVRENA